MVSHGAPGLTLNLPSEPVTNFVVKNPIIAQAPFLPTISPQIPVKTSPSRTVEPSSITTSQECLKLTFEQFRCWEHLVIQAPLNSITLIKGNSGIGKTTILQGITWCLYGNIRLVAPNHLEKSKTRVIIEIPYVLDGVRAILSINRQKNPGRLIVSHGANVYEDKVAQALIDDMFGTYDIWMASCYIGQGCRNSFLTAPNTGKMELLNSIAFHEEDPTTYIERIDQTITEADSDYKSKLAIFTNNYNTFQTLLITVDINKALTPEAVNDIKGEIIKLEQSRDRLLSIKSQRAIDLGILSNLQRQLEQANRTSVTVKPPDATLIALHTQFSEKDGDTGNISGQNIDSSIALAQSIIPTLQRRDDLINEVRKLDSMLLPYSNFDKTAAVKYTTVDYQDALSQETSQRDNQRIAQSLGVLYSESAISAMIAKYQTMISIQDQLKLEQEQQAGLTLLSQLELEQSKQLVRLEIPDIISQEVSVPDYSKYTTNHLSEKINELAGQRGAIQAHIQHLQKGQDVLQCPHCTGAIRYQQGVLVKADVNPVTSEEIITAQGTLRTINTEIGALTAQIQQLNMAENMERINYDKAVIAEQKRIETLKERKRQIELEQQRRDIANADRTTKIAILKKKLRELSESLSTYNHGSQQITPIDKRILSPTELKQTHGLIGKLSNIAIVPAPAVSSQHIQSYLTYQDLSHKYDAAVKAHSDYVNTIPITFRTVTVRDLNTYIDKLRIYWNQIKEITEERVRLERLQFTLQQQIDILTAKIPADPTTEITTITSSITQHQNNLSASIAAHDALKRHSQITAEREEVVNLNTVLSDLQVFRQHAVDTECHILQHVVESINSSIQDVCNTLFDRDISINLSLFKTQKTTKSVKPIANFSISYQGGIFDNINQMSGGEGDRASLALTLALNRLSSCPILMLDESLASLDLNMKEAAIKTIRAHTNGTVLIIMHDGIEGVFDHTIAIEEIIDQQQGRRY